MAWSNLPTDFTDAQYTGLRKYTEIDNGDGTVSFQDETEYTGEENSYYRAEDANATNEAVNTLMNMALETRDVDLSMCQGRLTFLSGEPIPSVNITNGETIHFTPYNGNKIALYYNGIWTVTTFTELSQSLSGLTRDIPYDVFVGLDANGEPQMSILSWGNKDVRPAAVLTRLDGIIVRMSDYSKRYVGTFVVDSDGYGVDSENCRGIWNQYNRVARPLYSKLITTKSQGTGHMNCWAPYYDEDAPVVKLLIPSTEADFDLEGVGMSSPISESDRGYQRAAAVGICRDMMTSSPYTNNITCVKAATHTFGNGPVSVSIRNLDGGFLGWHTYHLSFWTNYTFYPAGTNLSSVTNCYPGLQGVYYG